MKKANPAVDEFMDRLDHLFNAEVETVRETIKNLNKDIAEQIKWNAPSFRYKGEYDNRRMAYFADQSDIQAERKTLEKAVKELITEYRKVTN